MILGVNMLDFTIFTNVNSVNKKFRVVHTLVHTIKLVVPKV